jgi:PAS domain S-box-containing protein
MSAQAGIAEQLFDEMPDTVFFIKDTAGRYTAVNKTLVERCGASSKSALIGKTPSDVLGPELGRSYERQDRHVQESGEAIIDFLELHVYATREVGWCLTSKLPMHGENGAVAGVVGISRDLKPLDVTSSDFGHISAAIRFAEDNLAKAPTIGEMAAVASMSVYQLDRRMQQVFGLTTGQWILKTRIGHARRYLIESDRPIAEIALDVGYSDQSAFTRRFRRATGLSPSEYRRIDKA